MSSRRSSLLLSIAIAVTSLSACAHGRYAHYRCDWLPDAGATPRPATQQALAPINPDFASLRPFRNYVQVLDVGAYEEHFTVWFSCIEPNVQEFTARRGNGDHIVVTPGNGAWGGLAVRDGEPAPVPARVRDLSRAVLDEVRRHVPDARDLRIAYAGAYRPLRVHEVLPAGPAVGDAVRMASTAEITFAADQDLSQLQRVVRYEGGMTRLCWEDTNYVPCHGPARWLPMPVPTMDGSLLLPRFAQRLASGHANTEIMAALLRGAQDAEAGRAMPSLASIHEQEDGLFQDGESMLLLPTMRQQLRAEVSVYARVNTGDHGSAQSSLDFDVKQAVYGQASAQTRIELEGHSFLLEGTLAARQPPAADASGSVTLEFSLGLQLSDDEGHRESLDHSASGPVLVDGTNAAIAALTVADGDPDPNQVGQPHLALPGFGRFLAVDAYLGLTMHSMSGED